jgi:HK97 family phage major capsid protein
VKILEELRRKKAEAEKRMKSLHEAAGENAFTDEQDEEFRRLGEESQTLAGQIEREERRANFADSLRSRETEVETERGSANERFEKPEDISVIIRRDPFEMVERAAKMSPKEGERALISANLAAMEERDLGGADNEAHFEKTLRRHKRDRGWQTNLLARMRPEYESGFEKYLAGNAMHLDNEERAAMAVGTNTAGGYLVPTHLDPSLILTNSGSSNSIRQLARVATLTEGSTWNGVTTAGSTASWAGELVEVGDATPSVGRVSVTAYKAQALVQASIESTQDIPGLAADLLMILGDARDRHEGTAHATGTGSNQPWGIFTALDANTNVEIATATAGAIAVADIHGVYRSVPIRWRNRSQWLMNPVFNLAIKALGTAVSASYTTDLTQAPSDVILGKRVNESDDAPSSFVSTTQIENAMIFGDFSNYLIVDKPGSVSIEYIPHLFNTANNLPDGRRAWYMYWRTGADSINDLAFRLLQDKTSA